MGEDLAKDLKGGDVVALYGDLGAGKTVFVKGLAKGLGIKKRILSPTFIFMRSYPLTSGKQFVHIDLYRAQSLEDFEALGPEELFSKNNIVVLEWADKIAKMLPQKRIDVVIEKVEDPKGNLMVEDTERSRGKDEKPGRSKLIGEVKMSKTSSVILSETKDLSSAAEILKNGGVVIFPTDTVYGIGCRYDDKDAVDRIYKIKSRSNSQPFPVLVSSVKQVERLVIITPSARELIEKYWPGGLTILLKTKDNQKIGFRMPDHQEILSMINLVGVPIIGTSANFHGQPPPASFKKLDPKLIKLADFVLKGKSGGGIESTVVDITTGKIKILRQGAAPLIY